MALKHPDPSIASTPAPYVQKLVQRAGDFDVNGSWLKWYEIARPEVEMAALSAECRDVLRAWIEAGEIDLLGSPGFVEVHHCTDVVFLIVMTWANDNEIWQTALVRAHGAARFERVTAEHNGHRPMLCVWELVPVSHERDAWVSYLRSHRTDVDLAQYRRSTFRGMV